MLITILSTIVVLGVLILIHELGHFWAAKAVDIEVSDRVRPRRDPAGRLREDGGDGR